VRLEVAVSRRSPEETGLIRFPCWLTVGSFATLYVIYVVVLRRFHRIFCCYRNHESNARKFPKCDIFANLARMAIFVPIANVSVNGVPAYILPYSKYEENAGKFHNLVCMRIW